MDLLSCTFSPNQAVPAHLSPDSLAWSSAVHAITHTPVKSMQEMAHWSPQRAPHDPGAPISALYPGLRSARQDVFPRSTGLEVQRPDRLDLVVHPAKITRPCARAVSKDPQTIAVHPSNNHSHAANGTTKASAYLNEGSPASRSSKHRTSASNPCRFPQPIPFAVALSFLLPLNDLGASLKPPCGVQSISPATTRSRCPPHSCT